MASMNNFDSSWKNLTYIMIVCTTVLYEFTNRNYVNNLFVNMHMQIKIYVKFCHGIIYIAMKDIKL